MSKNDNLVVNISPIEVYERLAAEEKLNIVDVREAEEVAHGMIADATHVPLAELEFWLDEFDPDEGIIFVCKTGRRSKVASEFFIDKGYRKVKNLSGGMVAYQSFLKQIEHT